MTYTESIQYLFSLQKFGMKFGLNGVRLLLEYFDNPHNKFSAIHIAGTNGKGSTASMIASIFTAAGYKTGLYTSPHLVSFNERIRIDGKPVSSNTVKRIVAEIRPEVDKNNPTFFEVVTAIAFKYFADARVDIAIIETGLGGRLDATNIIRPIVSVITSISKEHTEILGSSIEKIAFEKAGIIKSGIPCVTSASSQRAIRVLRKVCLKRNSEFIRVQEKEFQICHSSLGGLILNISMSNNHLKNVHVALTGEHQAMNAMLAVRASEIASIHGNFTLSNSAIRHGLKNVRHNSGIRARLSIVKRKPLLLADVAHNPSAIHALCSSLLKMTKRKFHIVFGLMKDKNYKMMIEELKLIAKCVYAVEAKTERSRNVCDLSRELQKRKIEVKKHKAVADGLKEVMLKAGKTPILITGSHFVVGEALAYLKKEKYLTINQ